MDKLPQRLVNIRASDRALLTVAMDDQGVKQAIEREHEALSGRGRVLVRASGTEPLIRVMVEAPSIEETDEVCSRLQATVERVLTGDGRTRPHRLTG
jgi:phosphoglucosamine mutase